MLNRMTRRQTLAWGGALALGVIGLAGCGMQQPSAAPTAASGAAGAQKAAPTAASGATGAQKAAPAAAASSATKESYKMDVWGATGNDNSLKAQVDLWNKKNSNIQVTP